MPFVVPAMPLMANVWRSLGTGKNYAAPDLTVPCNLSPGSRDARIPFATGGVILVPDYDYLLVPALTDIRASWNGNFNDLVECPAGSKRFYWVSMVADVGKGFPNEYRRAILFFQATGNSTLTGGPFPVPTPLP